MSRETVIQIIREKGIKPGELVLVQWFLTEGGEIETLKALAVEGVLEPMGALVAGVQERYILRRQV